MELLAYSQESVPEKTLQLTAIVVAFYRPLQTIVILNIPGRAVVQDSSA